MSKQFVRISEINIEPRQRKEFSEKANQDLQHSLQSVGLLHAPVLEELDGKFILRAGERRVRAVKALADFGRSIRYDGCEVELGFIPYTSWADLTLVQRLQIEVDENQQRVAFTWQESAAALSKLAQLRELEAGAVGTERPTTKAIAIEAYPKLHPTAALDRTKTELILAQHLNNPEIVKAKTAKEALTILKYQERANANIKLAETVSTLRKSERFQVYCEDSELWAKEQSPGQFDVIVTDPPYGIGADNFGKATEGSVTAHGYEDSEEVLKRILDWFPAESFRLTKEEAHLYVFCDIDWFQTWKYCLTIAGWTVFRTPIVWVSNGFRAPWIDSGPQRRYELILYAKKGGKKVNMIAPDVIQGISSGMGLGHPAAKPPALYAELLRRSVRPGDKVLDPFCGTGPVFQAAYQLKCAAVGVEKQQQFYGECLRAIDILEG